MHSFILNPVTHCLDTTAYVSRLQYRIVSWVRHSGVWVRSRHYITVVFHCVSPLSRPVGTTPCIRPTAEESATLSSSDFHHRYVRGRLFSITLPCTTRHNGHRTTIISAECLNVCQMDALIRMHALMTCEQVSESRNVLLVKEVYGIHDCTSKERENTQPLAMMVAGPYNSR